MLTELDQSMTAHDHDELLHRRQRRRVWAGLATAIVLGTASQILWKYAAQNGAKAAPSGSALQVMAQTMIQPLFLVAIGLYVLQFFNWMSVLKHADLSYAQPITAASYVTVGLMAWWQFGESLPPHRLIGIGLILLGVYFISRTSHRSVKPQPRGFTVEPVAQREDDR